MGEKPIKLGSMTLLLTIVMLCLAVLAVLTLSTANADLALAQKHAERVRQVYALDARGEQLLAQVDQALAQGVPQTQIAALLPDDAVFDQNVVSFRLAEQTGQTLSIVLRLEDSTATVVQWKSAVQWTQEERLEGLWGAE